MEKIKFSIVIINYNSGEFLAKCVESIQDSTINNLSCEIIVVDNNSSDNSFECAVSKKNAKLIKLNENGGYARGANAGIHMSKGEFVLVANPDVLFVADSIEKMIFCAEDTPEIGIVGPKIKNFDGTIQYECKRNQPTLLSSVYYLLGLPHWITGAPYIRKEDEYYEKSGYVNAISGSCMLFKREALEKCGLFDEEFFMYGEDLDICYRMMKAGYKIFYNSQAVIHHYKGGCTKNNRTALNYKVESLIRLICKQNEFNFLQRLIVSQIIKIGYKAKMLKECTRRN